VFSFYLFPAMFTVQTHFTRLFAGQPLRYRMPLIFSAVLLFFASALFAQNSFVNNPANNGICIQGDCKNGYGTLLLPDRTAYRGNFKKSMASGQGLFIAQNGFSLEAVWENGWPKEHIVMFQDGAQWAMGWENGKLVFEEEDVFFFVDSIFLGALAFDEEETAKVRTPHLFQQDLVASQATPSGQQEPNVPFDGSRLDQYLENALASVANDTLFPSLEISQPPLASSGVTAFPFEQLFIEGISTDNAGIAWVRINGFDAELYFPDNSKTVHFAGNINLRKSGIQQILVESSDLAGNITRETYMVRFDENAAINQEYIARKTRFSPPRIYITHPIDPDAHIEAPESFINVRGYVVAFQGVQTVYINGVAASLDYPGAVKTNFDARVPVFSGHNDLLINATDGSGRRSKDSISVQIKEALEGEALAGRGKNWILAIGIDNYDFWRPLNNAVRDVKQTTDLLTTRYDFSTDRLIALYNKDANLEAIQAAMQRINQQAGPDDQVLILFSGHGDYNPTQNAGYWVPVDGRPNNRESYFSIESFQRHIQAWSARHVMVIADACFSGSILSENRGFVNQVGRYKSRRALVSGRLEPVSDGAAGYHSPFAEAVISYLQQNTRSAFASSQLEQFVKITVANMHQQTPLNGVIMNTGDRGGEFIFRLR